MRELILHIGTHKTGTTSLQMLLAGMESELLKDGILYPKSGRPSVEHEARYGHHRLAWAIRGKRGVSGYRDFDALAAEIQDSGAQTIVISSEEFQHCTATEVERIVGLLSDFNLTIILYLRNPLAYMRSAYKQKVKAGVWGGEFQSFLTHHIGHCDYEGLIRKWVNVVGSERMQIRSYDAVSAMPGLHKDFLSKIGLSRKTTANVDRAALRANVSPSDRSIEVTRLLNAFGMALRIPHRHGMLHRLRRSVLLKRTIGMGVIALLSPLCKEQSVSESEVLWLREQLSDRNRLVLRTYVPAGDVPYFDF